MAGELPAHVMDQSICLTEAATGRSFRLTPWQPAAAAPLALACVFSPDGRWIAYQRPGTRAEGGFPQIWAAPVPVFP